MAASPGRSRSKRLSSSAEKCWASAAEPPFPHARILPLAFQLSAVVELAADARQKVYAVLGRLGNDGFHTILILP